MFYFQDIIGQQDPILRLQKYAAQGNIPHALLFCGPEGTGKLQTAIAFASYLLCKGEKKTDDSCGSCPSCHKMARLVHPDLHFIFPVINKGGSQTPTISDDEISTWREFLTENRYFGLEDWVNQLDSTGKQVQISTREKEIISAKLALKSTEGGYKIMIIWHPEKMHPNCANSLLKILEEPPAGTVFILVTDNPDSVLETIVSRTQRIEFRRIPEDIIAARLMGDGYMLPPEQAGYIAHLSSGSWNNALKMIRINEESGEFLDQFMFFMRSAYARKVKDLKTQSDMLASKGREWQKRYLAYCQRMIRENFIYNFRQHGLTYLTEGEKTFSARFAPFVNEGNIIGLMEELSSAQSEIEQNVNSKMVFFDLALKTIVLIKQ